MEENKEHDFIDLAVERAYKRLVYLDTISRMKRNKKKLNRKQERQNRKRGRK